jgi:ribosomal protein S18 acetylase RimI-like enzyme
MPRQAGESKASAATTVRPMLAADLEAAASVAAAAFSKDLGDAAAARRWRDRIDYPRRSDPAGAFVAELDGRVIGVAEAMVRERVWCLSMLAVAPGIQSGGTGRALLERAVAYGRTTAAGLIVSSNDPRALRLYADAGFAMHPTFECDGRVDRRTLPAQNGAVCEDDGADLEALAALTRQVRGAPYTAELRFALSQGGRLLRAGDRGFAFVAGGQLWALVARDEEAARALLWNALALADGSARVRWITGAQQWAIDVVTRARLRLTAYGALCVRGTPGPLAPFLPTSPFA